MTVVVAVVLCGGASPLGAEPASREEAARSLRRFEKLKRRGGLLHAVREQDGGGLACVAMRAGRGGVMWWRPDPEGGHARHTIQFVLHDTEPDHLRGHGSVLLADGTWRSEVGAPDPDYGVTYKVGYTVWSVEHAGSGTAVPGPGDQRVEGIAGGVSTSRGMLWFTRRHCRLALAEERRLRALPEDELDPEAPIIPFD
jgi:hypothetical protein